MNGDKRNGDTFEFRPVQEEKKRVERRENDEYSTARKNYVSNKNPYPKGKWNCK